MKTLSVLRHNNERGVTALVVALVMFPLLAIAALAVDVSHLYVVNNELQNAADAGALAGARNLYDDDGTLVNVGANAIAQNAALANMSENIPVEVGGADVERGHWRFSNRTFTPNNSTAPVDLWDFTSEELDDNMNLLMRCG